MTSPIPGTTGTRNNHSSLFLNPDCYVLKYFTISPCWLQFQLVVKSRSYYPNTVTVRRNRWRSGILIALSLSGWLVTPQYVKQCMSPVERLARGQQFQTQVSGCSLLSHQLPQYMSASMLPSAKEPSVTPISRPFYCISYPNPSILSYGNT